MNNLATTGLAAACTLGLAACATNDTFETPGMLDRNTPLIGELMGEAVVPPPGNPAGSGQFAMWTGDDLGELCYELGVTSYEVRGVTMENFTGAHIHRGEASTTGPVVVPLADIQDRTSEGCADVDPALVSDIIANPANYYVQVHTVDMPQGAIRAQLKYSSN